MQHIDSEAKWTIIVSEMIMIQYESKVFNVQSKNWRIASLVYHTGSETKKK